MTLHFERSLRFLLREDIEGVHSAPRPGDQHDTWFGLARTWHRDMPWPPTREQAAARYLERYWLPVRGDELPWPVCLVLFDGAVQHDPRDSIKRLQEALGLKADGVLGPVTLAAVRKADPVELAKEVVARRMLYYWTLDNLEENDHGWARRLVDLVHEATTPEGESSGPKNTS